MKKHKICLQLFAEGASSGEAAPAAETVEDGNQTADSELATQETADNGQLATDTEDQEALDAEFKELIHGKYKSSYEKNFQQHLSQRLKGSTAKAEDYDRLKAENDKFKPVIEKLKSRYGTDDAEALDVAIEEDALYIREQAMNTGESEADILSNIRNSRQQKAAENAESEQRAAEQAELKKLREENAHREMLNGWFNEAEALKEKYPELNIREELRDKAFISKLAKGYSVEDAYITKHHNDIVAGAMSQTAKDVKDKTLATVAAGENRPSENGSSAQAPADSKVDVNSLTEKDIFKIMKDVENGKKITF